MEEWLKIFSSFLGGSLLTAVGFVIGYSNRLTKVETLLSGLINQVDTLQNKPNNFSCQFHNDIEHRVTAVEASKV